MRKNVKVTRIAICRNAAILPQSNASDLDSQTMPARLRRLSERIVERGMGLFATKADRDRFLDSLPDTERTRWVEILTRRRLAHVLDPGAVEPIHIQRTLAALKREYEEVADIVVCGFEHSRELGLTFTEPREPPEVASVSELDLVGAFGYDEEAPRQRRVVAAGHDRDAVWREWIAPLAPWVDHLAIVDRYTLHNERARRREEEVEQQDRDSGFRWLLHEILEARQMRSPLLKLEIVMARLSDKDVTRLSGKGSPEDHLRTAITSLGLREPDPKAFRSVTVWLADETFAREHLHERLIRLDGRVLDCGNGLVVFSRPKLFQRTKFGFGSFKESEDTLRLVETSCVGARWRSGAGLWLCAPGEAPLAFADDSADERLP